MISSSQQLIPTLSTSQVTVSVTYSAQNSTITIHLNGSSLHAISLYLDIATSLHLENTTSSLWVGVQSNLACDLPHWEWASTPISDDSLPNDAISCILCNGSASAVVATSAGSVGNDTSAFIGPLLPLTNAGNNNNACDGLPPLEPTFVSLNGDWTV